MSAANQSAAVSPRPDWDSYFLEIARVVATRATCDRKHVGSVVVSPYHQILSTGYNGSPPGAPHCDDVGHELKEMGGRMSCVRTIHAEANAIAQAARNGVSLDGSVLYTTASPCYDCGKLIANSGVKKVVFGEHYDSRYGMSNDVAAFLLSCGIIVSGFTATWRRDGGPTEVEKAVAAERERNVLAVRKIFDVILAGQPELGRAFVETKFREMLDVADVANNETIDRALYAERNRAVEICGPLLEKVFLKKSTFTAEENEQKNEFLRKLYNELHAGSGGLRKISECEKLGCTALQHNNYCSK